MNRVLGRVTWLALLAALTVTVVVAQANDQAQGTAQVAVEESSGWGPHLVDGEGRSLYIYLEDEEAADGTACVDICENNWPPFLAEDVQAGEGVDEGLLGTFTRPDGSTQVTYAGWPLYYFGRDAEAGHVRGQALGEVFYLVGAGGMAVTEPVEEERIELAEEEMNELLTIGQQTYASNCQVCHGDQGQGGIGPALANNRLMGDTVFLVERIIHGFPEHGMPPFGHLSDEEIAGVSTYLRTNWDNDFGPVIADQVEEIR